MWVSERERRKAAIKKEVEELKREIDLSQIEPFFKRLNINYRKGEEQILEIPFIGDLIILRIPSFTFKKVGGASLDTPLKAIILRYLKNLPEVAEGKEEDYRNLEELGVSLSKALKPLKRAFSYDQSFFFKCGTSLGGVRLKERDSPVLFSLLPGIESLFFFKEGEEEKGPELSIYFQKKATNIFSSSELLYMTKVLVRKILKEAKKAFSEYSF